jgi:nicotinamide riboside transporter PnuC
MTFFRWRKNAYKKTAVFKRMSNRNRVLFFAAVGLVWVVTAGVFYHLDYEYALLDSISFLLGFITPVLTMLAYIEYTYLWIISAVVGLLLSVQMVMNDYKETTYLIYAVYSLYCIILAYKNVHKFYKEQQSEKEKTSSGN